MDSELKMILGLDVSTSTIGMTVASYDVGNQELKVLEVGHLKLKVPSKLKKAGDGCLLYKSELFEERMKEKYSRYKITDVIIEEPLISSNNSLTAATLMRFNGMVSLIIYKTLGVTPVFISSYDARKFGCPSLMSVRKYNKKGEVYPVKKIRKSIKDGETVLFGAYPYDCAKKLILWNFVSEKYPELKWVYNAKGELLKENFDASDSLMCLLGYVSKLRWGDTEPVVSLISDVYDSHNKINKLSYSVNFCGETFVKTIEIPS
ncbi:MAG: hypothetical protein J6Y37_11105 [Paludibacteraceae bacterium]|nr:hypothetical protein [Paludibacteraceae bacterium]